MVQRFVPAFGCGDSYVQIFLDLTLPYEVIKMPRAQAGIKGNILGAGFTRYNVSYFNFLPLSFYLNKIYYIISLLELGDKAVIKIGLP